MIKAIELKKITNEHKTKEKIKGWIDVSLLKVDELLLERAKLGKTYLHLGQGNIGWMSVKEFKDNLHHLLVMNGYNVIQEHGNSIKITWN